MVNKDIKRQGHPQTSMNYVFDFISIMDSRLAQIFNKFRELEMNKY